MNVPDLTEPVPQPATSPGQALANRREDWGLTTQDVAANLNLGVDTIEAIEADDYSRLPGSTFVKGYIRSYARLLKLDAEDLLGSIDLQPERITEIPSSRAELKSKGKTRPREKKKSGRGFLRWILLLIIIGILVAFGLAQLPRLGVNQVSDLFPVSDNGAPASTGDPLQSLPQAEEGGQPAPATNSDQPQGALIRIE